VRSPLLRLSLGGYFPPGEWIGKCLITAALLYTRAWPQFWNFRRAKQHGITTRSRAAQSLAVYQDMLRQNGIFKTDEELSAELRAESVAEGTWPTAENIVIHAVLSDAELDEKLTKSMAQNGMFEEKTLEYLRKNGELQPACPQLVVGMPPSLSQLEVEWAQGHSGERIKNLPQRGHPKSLEELGLLVR